MPVQFHTLTPHPVLHPYIAKMWLFRSSGRMPVEDMKLIVPNGNLKITISYQNGMVAAMNGKTFFSKENDITLTGLVDVPVILDAELDIATEAIGIEFHPHGVYRFFHFNLNEISNCIYSLEDLLGKAGKQLTYNIAVNASVQQKLAAIQTYLIKQLRESKEDLILEYCVSSINRTGGTVSIKELEKKTGYSSRWLNLKFREKIGVSPKNLASVIRFKHYYQAFITGSEKAIFENDFYKLYYDQSHFIKEFKRFTGLPPARFQKQLNGFGESYYR